MPAVDRRQVKAFRLAAQHLTARLRAGALAEAAACALQNTPPETAALALHARVERLGRDAVERALVTSKTLLQAWSLRSAPHVFATEDQPVFLHAIAPRDEASIREFIFAVEPALDKVGLTAVDAVEHASAALEQVLDGRRMTKDELGVEMAQWVRPRLTASQQRQWKGRSWYAPGQSLGESIIRFFLPVLALRGQCCHAERRGGKAYLARTSQWLGQAVPRNVPAPAAGEIVRRYLRSLGPSTREDFTAWAGIAKAHAGELWMLVHPDLVEVQVEGRTLWLHRDAAKRLLSPLEPRGVRLLPPHDPYLALRDRDTIVADLTWQRRIWRTSGNPGVVVADGEVVAVWRPKASSTRLQLTIEWIGAATRRLKAMVDDEARSIGAFRGKPVTVTHL